MAVSEPVTDAEPADNIGEYLSTLIHWAKLPDPGDFMEFVPKWLRNEYLDARAAKDRLVCLLIQHKMGPGISRYNTPRVNERRKLNSDLPAVKEILPDHIAKDRRTP